MHLTSGPALYDRLYWSGFALVFLAWSGWFVYDGSRGWPDKNRAQAPKVWSTFGTNTELPGDVFDERPAGQDVEALNRDSGRGPLTQAQVQERLGQPFHTVVDETRRVEYFGSLYGVARATFVGDRLEGEVQWRAWYKDRSEIRQQFYWALVPLALALFFGYRFVQAALLRARVDDEGLTWGRQRVPFSAMTSLRDYSPKGWVDLYYTADDGREKRIRIDNQKIARFDEIVEAIAQARGFANPVKEYYARKQAQAAAESGGAGSGA